MLLEGNRLLLVKLKTCTEGPAYGDGEQDQQPSEFVGVGDRGLFEVEAIGLETAEQGLDAPTQAVGF